jgi:predicted dienelactone hydrolase
MTKRPGAGENPRFHHCGPDDLPATIRLVSLLRVAADHLIPVSVAAMAAFLLAVGEPARAAEEEATRIGDVDVVTWTPSARGDGRLPVLLFSHALYMCPTQSRYLTRALADAGYLVVAPRHADSSCTLSVWPTISRISGKPSLLWSDGDYRDRAEDVRKVVDALVSDPKYGKLVDLSRLGLVGHSLGGYTVLGLGGAWPSWRLPGVRAIVAMTPYSLPFQRSGGLRSLSVPTMYQAGSLDPVFTMPLEQFGYAQTPAPKFLVEISWANHMAWTDFGLSSRDAIVRYAIAFLDRYVRDAPEAEALHVALPGVSGFWRD